MDNKKLVLISVILMLFIISISSANAGELNTAEDLTINEELAIDNGESITLNENNENIDNNLINEDNAASIDSSDELEDANFENIEHSDDNKKSSVLSDSNTITVTDRTFSGIQNAIDGANVGDTIILVGAYSNDKSKSIIINKNLNFVGLNDATLDANHLSLIFNISSINVTIKNIYFLNGNTNGDGGAIFSSSGGSIVNCSFVNNSASGYYGGGAIKGAVDCVNCSFVNNSARRDGGAIYGSGSVVNCSFVNNSASGSGGAIYCGYSSVVNCSFVNNSALSSGGAIKGAVDCVNCSFVNNSVSGGQAGACLLFHGSIVDCSFVNNSASSDGGAIKGAVDCVNCSFVNNSARRDGGAIYSSSFTSIINCSFVNNSASGSGGAINATVDSINCVNCSFVNNSANYSGAIYVSGGVISNCSFVNNSAIYSCGAINLTSGVEVSNCTFENNTANKDPNSNALLELEGFSFVLGDDGILIANLFDVKGPLSDYTISFTINDIIYNLTTNSSGSASLNVTNIFTELGSYLVKIYFNGEGIYSSILKNGTVDVHQYYDPILILNDFTFFNGKDGHLVANLSDSRGPLVNHVLTFTVNGEDVNVTTNASGLASINLKNYFTSLGTYYVNVSFAGDGYDNAASANAVVNVIRDTSTLTVNNVTVLINTEGNLIANFSDSCGPLANHSLTFVMGSSIVKRTTDSRGIAIINIKSYFTNAGEYNVRISFAGDDYDTPVSTNATVIINKYVPILDVNNLSVVWGDDCNLTAILSDSRGKLSSKEIVFSVNGNLISNTTNSQGSVTLNIKDCLQSSGEYAVCVSFAGDEYDEPVSTNATVIVNRCLSTIVVDDLSVVLGDDAILTAYLSNRYGPLSGKSVIFSIDGMNISKTSISSGIVTLNIKQYLSTLGEYNVGVIFEGDDLNAPTSTNAIVRVNSYIATLSVCQVGKYYNDTILRFNLTDNKTNLGRSGANIKLVLSNGDSAVLTTDSKGIVDFDIPFVPGTYSVNASVIDSNVDVNDVALSFEIKHRVGVIEVTQNGTGYNNSILCIKLYDDVTGDVFRNVKVDLDFVTLGVSDDVVTDDDGVAVYSIPFNVGTYYVLVSVNEEYAEFESVEKDDIVIEKSDSVIVFDGDIGLVVGGSGSTNFTVIGGSVNENNIRVIDHPEAVISLNDNVIAVSNLNIGTYTLQVITTPDNNHNSFCSNVSVTVYESTPSSLIFEKNITFDYGSSGSTNFTVIGGSVDVGNISVVDHPEAVIDLNGDVVSVSNLTVGKYSLKFTTTPDFRHTSAVFYVNITVNKVDSYIEFTNDINFDYASSGSTTMILNGCTVNLNDITVLGHSEAIIILKGNKISVFNLPIGEYILSVVSTPDSNHNSVTSACNITVNRIPSAISFTDIKFEYGSSGSTTLLISGGTVNEENVLVIGSDGIPYSNVVRLNGNNLTIFNLDIGDYTLVITTTPDGNHSAVTADASITVTERASNVIFNNDVSVDVGKVAVLNLTVVGGSIDIGSLSISGQSPTFEVDKVDGDYLVYISNLPAGSHTLKVTTIPDSFNHYYSVSKSCVIDVRDPRTNTSISWGSKSMKFAYGGSGSVTVAVTGGTLSANNIVVVGHKEAVIKYSSGKITVSNLTVGTYTLKVTPTADANHIAKAQNITITVTKIPAVITAKAITVYYKNTKKWSIKLINNSTKKALASKYIVLKVYTGKKYKTYKVKTNSKGIATFSVPKTLSVATHKVVLSYSASNTNCKSVTSKIVVKKQVLTINIGFQKFTDGSRTVDIIVKDKASKKALNKIKVKVMIYTGSKVTKTYTKLVTAYYKHNKENGFAMYGGGIKAFGKAGTHKIVVKPVDSKYAGKSNTIKISVPKSAKSIKTFVVSGGKVSTLK